MKKLICIALALALTGCAVEPAAMIFDMPVTEFLEWILAAFAVGGVCGWMVYWIATCDSALKGEGA